MTIQVYKEKTFTDCTGNHVEFSITMPARYYYCLVGDLNQAPHSNETPIIAETVDAINIAILAASRSFDEGNA